MHEAAKAKKQKHRQKAVSRPLHKMRWLCIGWHGANILREELCSPYSLNRICTTDPGGGPDPDPDPNVKSYFCNWS